MNILLQCVGCFTVAYNCHGKINFATAKSSVVRSARPASFTIFCSAVCTAPSIGTLVNSDSTSKDTMISWSWISSLAMVEAKSVEFFTVKFELPEIIR